MFSLFHFHWIFFGCFLCEYDFISCNFSSLISWLVSITKMTKIIYILIIIVFIMKDIINPNVEIPDDQVAMAFFRSVRWVNGVYCPKCKSYNVNSRGNQGRTRRYVCKDCGANFNDFSGTIFHKSKIPLNVMLYILFNLDKKTTTQLSEELDYSRQCISRISKLFREKLLSNPEYFDIDEWFKNFFLKNSYCFLAIRINFWIAE